MVKSNERICVNFSEPNIHDHGVRQPVFITEGPVSPLIFIQTLDDFLDSYLGCCNWNALSNSDWLSFSEHRLLALTSGEFYQDDLGIKKYLEAIAVQRRNQAGSLCTKRERTGNCHCKGAKNDGRLA